MIQPIVTPEELVSAGRKAEAVDAYERQGRFQEAARLAWNIGAYLQAAELSERAGLSYETSMCYFEAGQKKKALHHLVRSPVDVPDYRLRAMKAIRLASELKEIDLRFDTYVRIFLQNAPLSVEEGEVVLLLVDLFFDHGFKEQAKEAVAAVLKVLPKNEKALEIKYALEQKNVTAAALSSEGAPISEDETILQNEMAFRRQLIEPVLPMTQADDITTTISSGEGLQTQPDPLASSSWDGNSAIVQAPPTLEPNSAFGPRYILHKTLGRGGMAIVFEATDLELSEKVAIKVFTQLMANEEQEQRFRREVILARQLTHPNIIRVYDIGKVHQYRFITMELLEGYDLDRYLVPGKSFNIKVALRYLLQACSGLGYAHKQGVVHRDVKPANFFVAKTGTLKIMDFGIAKNHNAKKVTSTGMILGTPEYISPEQINDFANTSYSTDLYALGIMLYQMITGQVPFDADAPVEILMQHLNHPPVPPRTLNPEIPVGLQDVTLKLLEKKPADRFQDCHELSLALREVLSALK